MRESKFVAMLVIVGAIPLLVALSEVVRAVGTDFSLSSILAFGFVGVLELLAALSITEKVKFFEGLEELTMWSALIGIYLAAIFVLEASI